MDFLLEYGGVDAAPWAGGMSPADYTAYIGSPSTGSALGGNDFMGALSSIFNSGAAAYATVKTADAKAKMMTQYSPYGGYYVEGMPATRYGSVGISPLMLLLIGGVVIFALKN